MHDWETNLCNGLVRPTDFGVLIDEPGYHSPRAGDGEECKQEEHDDPVHPAAAVRLLAEDMPEKVQCSLSNHSASARCTSFEGPEFGFLQQLLHRSREVLHSDHLPRLSVVGCVGDILVVAPGGGGGGDLVAAESVISATYGHAATRLSDTAGAPAPAPPILTILS